MKSKIFKRIAAFVLAAITAFSFIPGTTAFAAGEAGNITFDYCYDSNGNMILYNGETDVDGYLAGGTGHPKPRMFVDGETAYCIQPGRHLLVNDTLYRSSSAAWDALSAGQKKAIGLALLYGYQGNWSNLSGSDDEKWVATAELVWEFVTGCRESTSPYKQVSTAIYDIQFGSNQPNTGVLADYNQIVAWMQRHSIIPSFMSGSASVASQDLEYKDGKYSLTFTDTNGVLAEFNFSSSNSKVSVSKSGNTLTLSADDPFDGTVTITASRNNIPTVSSSAKLIAYGDPNLQDVVTGVENADPVYAYLNVETPTGNLDLKKTSEDGVVAGICFTIYGEKMERTVTTAEDGTIFVDGLIPGVYTVTEQSFDRYLPQDVQRVTVIGGRTTTVAFNNVLKRGDLTVTKTSEDGMVEGIKFHLYGTSLSGLPVDEYAVTDSTGKATFKDVLIGSGYTLEEVDVSVKYVVPASQKAAIEWNKVTEKSFSNILKKWNATVTKSDSSNGTAQGDATLAGAVYGVYQGDTLIDTYTTDGKGQFVTPPYVCGDDWSIREISPSEGYLLDSTVHHIGAEAKHFTVEYNPVSLDVTEQIIKGNIAIIKHCDDGETQIEPPEVGATFAIYLKAAGDYGSAKESEKDYLTCDENGFAQSKDYRLGVYSYYLEHPDIKERAKYLQSYHSDSGSYGGNDNTNYGSKGLSFSHGDIMAPYAKLDWSWTKAARRIETLIHNGSFLYDEDRAAMPEYERRQLAIIIQGGFSICRTVSRFRSAIIPSRITGKMLRRSKANSQIRLRWRKSIRCWCPWPMGQSRRIGIIPADRKLLLLCSPIGREHVASLKRNGSRDRLRPRRWKPSWRQNKPPKKSLLRLSSTSM